MNKPETYKAKNRILVVDDDRGTRLTLRHALEKDGYGVLEAGDGIDALCIFEKERPDLVLMDCMMPRLDGFTACSQLRKQYSGLVPVLMLTGLHDENSVELAFESGAVDYITKPINWAVLSQRVSRLVRARKTEQRLDRSEEEARSIFSYSMDGIITIDAYGLIKSFNPAAESMFGYSPAEVVGWDVHIILPSARLDDDSDTGVVAPGRKSNALTRETLGKRADGLEFPVIMTISGFRTGDRLLTVRDITAQKKAEEQLRLAARVIENITEGMLVYDKNTIICQLNRAFTVMTGYGPEEVLGRSLAEIKFGHIDPEIVANMQVALEKQGHWLGETTSLRKSGETYPIRLSISAIKDDQGRATHFAAVFYDITERVKFMEERQRLMDQYISAQRLASLGTVSAGIAHEINQPLNSIKVIVDGMLYWHKKGRFPEKEKIIENLQKISARAGRIDDIIKHMRSFVSAGNSARCEPCSLNGAVSGALGMLGQQLSSHGIFVAKNLSEGLPEVYGNAVRLEEVVVNLLVNAMQALDAKDSRNREIVCRTGREGGNVFMEICDNGTGIDSGIMESIFDPFFSTKQAGEGMGLGLSIVQSIVSGCGGEIRVFNNAGGGATFRLEFRPEAENKEAQDNFPVR